MSFQAELKLTINCESCPAHISKRWFGGECGILEEESQLITDFLYDAEFDSQWELVRESYLEHKFYCPSCKQKNGGD